MRQNQTSPNKNPHLANHSEQRGFSLIELIVFVAILSTILVTMAGFTLTVHRRLQINSHKVLANHAAESLKEWLNGERLSDWQAFQAKATPSSNSSPPVYCVNGPITLSDSVSSLTAGGTCNFDGITGTSPQIFKRELTLVVDPSGSVTASITVSWLEDGTPYSVKLSTVYSFWQ